MEEGGTKLLQFLGKMKEKRKKEELDWNRHSYKAANANKVSTRLI